MGLWLGFWFLAEDVDDKEIEGGRLLFSTCLSGKKTEKKGTKRMDSLQEKIFSLLTTALQTNDYRYRQQVLEALEGKIETPPVQRALWRTLIHLALNPLQAEEVYKELAELIEDETWTLTNLKALCRSCQEQGNQALCRQAIARAQKYQVESIILPLLYEESITFIKFITSCFDFKVEDYLGEMDSNDYRAQYLVPEFVRSFNLSGEEIENLYAQTQPGKVRDILAGFLQIKLGRKIDLPEINPLFFSLPNPSQYLKWLEKKVEIVEEEEKPTPDFKLDPEEEDSSPLTRLEIHQVYAISPFHLRVGLLQLDSVQEIVGLDRYYTSLLGPVNTLYDADFSSIKEQKDLPPFRAITDRCLAYGGCRQFVCSCFESSWEEEDDEPIEDWFTGKCQSCQKDLFDQYQCYRKPLTHGGWLGCFCSLECCEMTKEEDQLYNAIYHYTHQLLDPR